MWFLWMKFNVGDTNQRCLTTSRVWREKKRQTNRVVNEIKVYLPKWQTWICFYGVIYLNVFISFARFRCWEFVKWRSCLKAKRLIEIENSIKKCCHHMQVIEWLKRISFREVLDTKFYESSFSINVNLSRWEIGNIVCVYACMIYDHFWCCSSHSRR